MGGPSSPTGSKLQNSSFVILRFVVSAPFPPRAIGGVLTAGDRAAAIGAALMHARPGAFGDQFSRYIVGVVVVGAHSSTISISPSSAMARSADSRVGKRTAPGV